MYHALKEGLSSFFVNDSMIYNLDVPKLAFSSDILDNLKIECYQHLEDNNFSTTLSEWSNFSRDVTVLPWDNAVVTQDDIAVRLSVIENLRCHVGKEGNGALMLNYVDFRSSVMGNHGIDMFETLSDSNWVNFYYSMAEEFDYFVEYCTSCGEYHVYKSDVLSYFDQLRDLHLNTSTDFWGFFAEVSTMYSDSPEQIMQDSNWMFEESGDNPIEFESEDIMSEANWMFQEPESFETYSSSMYEEPEEIMSEANWMFDE